MDESSSVTTVGTSDAGLTPSTILGGCSQAQNGVSVRNMPEEKAGYDWFVFRASYSREEKASELIERLNAPAYVARHTVYTRTKTGVKSEVKTLIPNLVFAYLTHQEAELFVKGPTLKDQQFQDKTDEEKRNILKLTQIVS